MKPSPAMERLPRWERSAHLAPARVEPVKVANAAVAVAGLRLLADLGNSDLTGALHAEAVPLNPATRLLADGYAPVAQS